MILSWQTHVNHIIIAGFKTDVPTMGRRCFKTHLLHKQAAAQMSAATPMTEINDMMITYNTLHSEIQQRDAQ